MKFFWKAQKVQFDVIRSPSSNSEATSTEKLSQLMCQYRKISFPLNIRPIRRSGSEIWKWTIRCTWDGVCGGVAALPGVTFCRFRLIWMSGFRFLLSNLKNSLFGEKHDVAVLNVHRCFSQFCCSAVAGCLVFFRLQWAIFSP